MKNSLGVDLDALNKEQLTKLLAEYKNEADKYHNYEQAIKLTLNSIYGATGNEYAFFFNRDIAETITLQGQDAILYTEEIMNKYFIEFWHKDIELHKKMGLSVHGRVAKPCVVYIDTDSLLHNTNIYTKNGTKTIEDFYNENVNNLTETTSAGHESVSTADSVLNWSKDKNLYYAKVKRIIRHKVTKDKYMLKTKTGKEVIVTGDHSLVVFRDGQQLVVKPYEILNTDKILSTNV